LGICILMEQTGKVAAQVLLIPAGTQALVLDANFGRFLLFEQIEGDMPQCGQILSTMVSAYAAFVLTGRFEAKPRETLTNRLTDPDRLERGLWEIHEEREELNAPIRNRLAVVGQRIKWARMAVPSWAGFVLTSIAFCRMMNRMIPI
jgi:hypothetical protein